MRKKIVAGNWKMNKTFAEGVELAREVNDYVRYKEGGEGVLVVLGTPFIHLAKVAHNIKFPQGTFCERYQTFSASSSENGVLQCEPVRAVVTGRRPGRPS